MKTTSAQITMEEQQCAYCLEQYKQPVYLSCGHSICKRCAHDMYTFNMLKLSMTSDEFAAKLKFKLGQGKLASQDVIQNNFEHLLFVRLHCPHCSQVTLVKREAGIAELQANDLLEQSIVAKVSSCEHDCENKATLFCVSCNCKFCTSCFEMMHQRDYSSSIRRNPLKQ